MQADQTRVTDPNYRLPFQSVEDALSRLLPYHVYSEDIPPDIEWHKGEDENVVSYIAGSCAIHAGSRGFILVPYIPVPSCFLCLFFSTLTPLYPPAIIVNPLYTSYFISNNVLPNELNMK